MYVTNSNPVLFSAQTARLKDWVLVLYGTERDPEQTITSTTTTTSTSQPPTTPKKRHRKHNSPITSPYYRFDGHNISSRLHKNYVPVSYNNNQNNKYRSRINLESVKQSYERPSSQSQGRVQDTDKKRIQYYPLPQNSWGPHAKNEVHMCIFETLAKRSNISTRQYYQMMKKDLSSGKEEPCDIGRVICNVEHFSVGYNLMSFELPANSV